jgi:hypothetical protein
MESKKEGNWVIIDAGGIEVLINTTDEWYEALHAEYPVERPATLEDIDEPNKGLEEDEFWVKAGYNSEDEI